MILLFHREPDVSLTGEILDQIVYKMSKIPETHAAKCAGLTKAERCDRCFEVYGDALYAVKLQISLARNK